MLLATEFDTFRHPLVGTTDLWHERA